MNLSSNKTALLINYVMRSPNSLNLSVLFGKIEIKVHYCIINVEPQIQYLVHGESQMLITLPKFRVDTLELVIELPLY